MMISLIMMRSLDVFNIKWFSDFAKEVNQVSILISGQFLSESGMWALAVILEIITVILYFLSFILYEKSVGKVGVYICNFYEVRCTNTELSITKYINLNIEKGATQ